MHVNKTKFERNSSLEYYHMTCIGKTKKCTSYSKGRLRACLHGRGGPQEGEVTRFGGVARLSIQSLIWMWSRLHVRWGNPPHVTSPTWGPPPSCKQALSLLCQLSLKIRLPSYFILLNSSAAENSWNRRKWYQVNREKERTQAELISQKLKKNLWFYLSLFLNHSCSIGQCSFKHLHIPPTSGIK